MIFTPKKYAFFLFFFVRSFCCASSEHWKFTEQDFNEDLMDRLVASEKCFSGQDVFKYNNKTYTLLNEQEENGKFFFQASTPDNARVIVYNLPNKARVPFTFSAAKNMTGKNYLDRFLCSYLIAKTETFKVDGTTFKPHKVISTKHENEIEMSTKHRPQETVFWHVPPLLPWMYTIKNVSVDCRKISNCAEEFSATVEPERKWLPMRLACWTAALGGAAFGAWKYFRQN